MAEPVDPKESIVGMHLLPVQGWDIGPIPGSGFVALRLHYLPNHRKPDEVLLSQPYVMTRAQLDELVLALKENRSLLDALETSPSRSAH